MESGGSGVLGITAYARLAGKALLLIAATGLALFGWYQSAIYYHAGLGLFFLFVGFSRLESTYVRQMVGVSGCTWWRSGTTILATWLSPLRYLHGPIGITSLIAGVASVVAARYLPDRRSSLRRGQGVP